MSWHHAFKSTLTPLDNRGVRFRLRDNEISLNSDVVAGCSAEEVAAVVALALEEAAVEPSAGLHFAAFEAALGSADLLNMQVDI